MFEMSSHCNLGEYAPTTETENVRTSIGRPARGMQEITVSFIARHSKSILTVSNETMRQSMVSIASSPCTYPMARFVRCKLALMQRR